MCRYSYDKMVLENPPHQISFPRNKTNRKETSLAFSLVEVNLLSKTKQKYGEKISKTRPRPKYILPELYCSRKKTGDRQ